MKKWFLWFLVSVLVLPWSIYYMINYKRSWHKAILNEASRSLMCPQEEIRVGAFYQPEESGPTHVPVSGCKKNISVICQSEVPPDRIWEVFFHTTVKCLTIPFVQ